MYNIILQKQKPIQPAIFLWQGTKKCLESYLLTEWVDMPKGNFKWAKWRWNKNIRLGLHLQQIVASFKMYHVQTITCC